METTTPTVKKSVSMPESLWGFVDESADQAGHGVASRVVQEAIDFYRKFKNGEIEGMATPPTAKKAAR